MFQSQYLYIDLPGFDEPQECSVELNQGFPAGWHCLSVKNRTPSEFSASWIGQGAAMKGAINGDFTIMDGTTLRDDEALRVLVRPSTQAS